MSAETAPKLTSVPYKIVVAGEAQTLQFFVDDNEIVGCSNAALLSRWLESKAPRPRNVITAATITDVQRRDIRFFGETPCWFEGCAELRAAFAEEKARLEAKPDCKDCETGALMRKYLKKVADAQKIPAPLA